MGASNSRRASRGVRGCQEAKRYGHGAGAGGPTPRTERACLRPRHAGSRQPAWMVVDEWFWRLLAAPFYFALSGVVLSVMVIFVQVMQFLPIHMLAYYAN